MNKKSTHLGSVEASTAAQQPRPALRDAARPGVQQPALIERGVCSCMFVYDIGSAIDLEQAQPLAAERTQREPIKHQRTAPDYFEFQPSPLRVSLVGQAIQLGRFATSNTINCILYEFGAVSVVYEIDIAGSVENLSELSAALYDNQVLQADSRQRVSALLNRIDAAVYKSSIAPITEDYVIYRIESLAQPTSAVAFVDANASQIAQILRSERKTLSDQEIEDAVGCRISYTADDVTIIDWQASILIGHDVDDVEAVLEFANVELLEMRFLDDRLDQLLDQFHKSLSQRNWRPWFRQHAGKTELRRLAKLQMEGAVLFEEVNNALKLFGDQFLARLYRLAAQRLHISDWDASILRKLQTIESLYDKIADHQNIRRMEMLEWIIIVLIALSMVLALLPSFTHS